MTIETLVTLKFMKKICWLCKAQPVKLFFPPGMGDVTGRAIGLVCAKCLEKLNKEYDKETTMTKKEVNKYQKEILALGEGKIIQWREENLSGEWSEWKDSTNPSFTSSSNFEYRIKPEPKELWCIYTLEDDSLYQTCLTKEYAEKICEIKKYISRTYVVHFIEDTTV